MDKRVFKNLSDFTYKSGNNKKSAKKPGDDLFDQLTVSLIFHVIDHKIIKIAMQTTSLNKYLKEFMTSLSAKVFRTFNASLTLEKELAKMPATMKAATNDEKVLFFNVS